MTQPLRVLVWHWGRRGGGPRYAADLAAGLRKVAGVEAALSLPAQAELLHRPGAPPCELVVPTYTSAVGFVARLLTAPLLLAEAVRWLLRARPDVAVCAMPALLDLVMVAALRICGVPFLVVVHDAELHPGDGVPMQMTLQRLLLRRADGLITLSDHVAQRLHAQGFANGTSLVRSWLPPEDFGAHVPPPFAHGGPARLLFLGRLLPYKGLDLLAQALALLGPRGDIAVRVVGSGPDSPALAALRDLPGVTVENRWVPEEELGGLLAWADAVVLPYREASQSGVAAAALTTGRLVIATRVGGLVEQLADAPLARLCAPDPAAIARALAALPAERATLRPAPVQRRTPREDWQADLRLLVDELAATVTRRRSRDVPAGVDVRA